MKLESYQTIANNELVHSGHSYQELANQYGTPLYIFDEASFRRRIESYTENFHSDLFETQVLFASKSLLTKAIAKIIAISPLGQDVVSAGEIFVGLAAGVNPNKMYFHGNNKSDEELVYALQNEVGTIVLDNRMEASRLEQIAEKMNKRPKVLLRINPGVEAHTHQYIQTASLDSKFGESIFDDQIFELITQLHESRFLNFVGFHSHIGSQVFERESFFKASLAMMEFAQTSQEKTNYPITEINFGGGFGVYYTEEDQPFEMAEFLPEFVKYIEKESIRLGLQLNKICIEPGRSLVNASGSTLYRIGDLKDTVSGKHYLFVDGGMSDNIRPALYQAQYEATITNKITEPATIDYTVAGKACESGDKLIENITLPQAATGDLLLVNGTGAYNYTMASNYNRLARPAMIHIDGAHHRLTVKRETFEDMMKNELD
ncbi:diaminopimelate decarboxylase [Globicatella sanguinis]|uniref:diaminopimelate decarboxylase n=1 Tax=Globicatella sanguinis TaxID=13076 RepID=UPI0008250748|nr:diaminopimelate decarboxylase [Globicatella sanguinis]